MSHVRSAQREETPFLQQVGNGEQHWAWKVGLRAGMCILDIIGIGCAGWITALAVNRNSSLGYSDGFSDDGFLIPWALIPMGLSFIWCLICILVLLLRRPPRPAHPGIAVGLDLILWLIFIVTGLCAIGAVFTLAQLGSGDYIEDPNYSTGYSGSYYLAPNNTWVYNMTEFYQDECSSGRGYGGYAGAPPGCRYNYTTGTYTLANATKLNVHRTCGPEFQSCAEQDAYVNKLWHTKDTREGVEIVVTVVQWLGVLIHFILFVWACVDTHRRNNRDKEGKEQAMATRVIRDMEARGLITVHGAAGRGEPQVVPEMTPAGRAPPEPS